MLKMQEDEFGGRMTELGVGEWETCNIPVEQVKIRIRAERSVGSKGMTTLGAMSPPAQPYQLH